MLRKFLRRPWFAILVVLGVLIWRGVIPEPWVWRAFFAVMAVILFVGMLTGKLGSSRGR